MFPIQDENNTDNTRFSCRRAVLTPSQRVSCFSRCLASEEAGAAPEAGRGHTERADDPNWPKVCPMPYDIRLNNRIAESCPGGDSNCSLHHYFVLFSPFPHLHPMRI